jgi:Tol biopolymer transport system component
LSANKELQDKLKIGIDAARNGDRATARKLLQEVIRADPRSELAWMWLASTTDNVAERRACLSKALEINPDNTRAKEALDKLGVEATRAAQDKQKVDDLRRIQRGQAAASLPSLPGAEDVEPRGFNPLYLVIIVLMVLGIGSAVAATVIFSQQSQQTPPQTQISLADAQATIDATLNAPTATGTERPTAFGVIVDSVEGIPTLPPTFTPTFTPTATETAVPSPTPFPLSAFTLLYASIDEGAEPTLYRANGDGTNPELVGEAFSDIAFSPDGSLIAFVRNVVYTEEQGGGTFPEIFLASLDDLANARQLTSLMGEHTGHPSWAPDNIQIVFSSDPNGADAEIFVMTEDGNNIRAITDNEAQDIDPAWSPDGNTIVYASDINSAGSTEIYTMTTTGEGVIQLTDNEGSSYSPQWSWDGAQIVFASDRSGDSDIYLMEANGDGEFLLTSSDEDAEDRDPVFSSSGATVVFISNRSEERFQAYGVDLRGTTVTPITTDSGDVQSVAYQPDLSFRLQP